MRAVTFDGPRQMSFVERPTPGLIDVGDAIVEVRLAAICGTDLHPYRGELEGLPRGAITGHEAVGIVREVGSQVRAIGVGDRVVLSDVIACGTCRACRAGHHYQCDRVGLFGYGTVVGDTAYDGCHADFVRVPFADAVALPVPEALSDEQAIFVGDGLSTGYCAAEAADIEPGDVVVVVGAGPVGLLSMMAARAFGAGLIVAVDPQESRRAAAGALVADIALDAGADIADRLREATGGGLADACIEAVGNDAALHTALELASPHAVIACIGSHSSAGTPVPLVAMFARELTLRFAVGDPIRVRDRVFQLLENGVIDPLPLISERVPLADVPAAFARFDRGESVKVLIEP